MELKKIRMECKCKTGYVQEDDWCIPCPQLCATCDTSGACYACKANAGTNLDFCDCEEDY